jgi:hypothetical protein
LAKFAASFDTQLNIYRRVGVDLNVGVASKYVTEEHPNTDNLIEGWKYDETRWGTDLEDNAAFSVPTLWDPSTLGISNNFVTGIGDNNDLKVLQVVEKQDDFVNAWRPEVLHGHYYVSQNEYYLHSDDGVVEYPTYSGMVPSGGNTFQLNYTPKLGIPIIARSYEWDDDAGQYTIDRDIRKKIDFSGQVTTSGILPTRVGPNIVWQNVSTAEKEFLLDYATVPPTVYFNQQIVEQVGEFYTTLSGLSTNELNLMDEVGTAGAEANQQYQLRYSPVDRTMPIQLLMDYEGAGIVEWDVVETLTSGVFNQAALDYDLGIIKFGGAEEGGLPPYGSSIRLAYHKTVGVEYEPTNSRDIVGGDDSDLNPIRRYSGSGFVHLRRTALDVHSLTLTAQLPEISSNYYGPLFLGNDYAVLECEALARSGETIEGLRVNFEILDFSAGSFGADETAIGITNGEGVAKTIYNPPRTVEELGGTTDNITFSGLTTTLSFNNYAPPSEDAELFLFQVAREDHILGVSRNDLAQYYEDFLVAEELGGPEITGVIGGFSPAVQWEILHRAAHQLQTPIVYEEGDLRTGKKTVVAELNPEAINPHTGTTPAYAPVQPESFAVTGPTSVDVQFDTTLPDITTGSITKSYLIVGPTNVRIRAWALNERLNTIVYSNTITVLVDVPPAAKGLVNIDAVNSVPSGLLLNTLYWDQNDREFEEVEVTTSGLLPLGFRLRSPGITLASALDGLTFLDLQPLNTIGATVAHQFTVT